MLPKGAAMKRIFGFIQGFCAHARLAVKRRPIACWLAASLSLLGLVSLSYLAGASVMYFGLPSSDYLTKAFTGIEDSYLQNAPSQETRVSFPGFATGSADDPDIFDGYTLITTNVEPRAQLIDLDGKVAHSWKMPARRPWPRAAHVREPSPERPVYWVQTHLYPNGDLLALCGSENLGPYGYGLVKLDKNSNVIWAYSANVHHDFCVEGDRIYLLTQQLDAKPPTELDLPAFPYLPEQLVVLSSEGRELEIIPLYEALRGSPYFLHFLAALEQKPPAPQPGGGAPAQSGNEPPSSPRAVPKPSVLQTDTTDILHSNSVRVLGRDLAERFPQFPPGMILISLRTPGLLIGLDPQKHAVVWATGGPWAGQHDAQFLANGHLLLYDNLGSKKGARVLEYDPVSQAIMWAYSSEKDHPLIAPFQGGAQRLPNGNTLIVEPSRRVLEATTNKTVVWQYHPPLPPPMRKESGVFEPFVVTAARRYPRADLTFLQRE
jgi:hypothetical protein